MQPFYHELDPKSKTRTPPHFIGFLEGPVLVEHDDLVVLVDSLDGAGQGAGECGAVAHQAPPGCPLERHAQAGLVAQAEFVALGKAATKSWRQAQLMIARQSVSIKNSDQFHLL